MVENLARVGIIVSLGSGADDIIPKLNPHVYSSYLGIDISKVAINQAMHKAKRLGLENCQFSIGDISKWEGDKDTHHYRRSALLLELSSVTETFGALL